MAQVTVIDRDNNRTTVSYDDTKAPIEGGEGKIYFSDDRRSVLKFYWDKILPKKDQNYLQKIVENSPEPHEEEHRLFGWPDGLIVEGNNRVVGVRMPNVAYDHWMEELIWYTDFKVFMALEQSKRGTFRGRVQAAIDITNSIRRLNFSGVTQGDISGRNFLINPVKGRAALIDLDGLIETGVQEGNVVGTPGFMAPELVKSLALGETRHPDRLSDRHALAVLLFGLLLMHHPVGDGAMPALANDIDADNYLRFGEQALYVHHPTDHRNRAHKQFRPLSPAILGTRLEQLFTQSFIDGLHNPPMRPQHEEYRSALVELEEDLLDCKNPNCIWRAFPSHGYTIDACPICGTKAENIPARAGFRVLNAHPDMGFFKRTNGQHVLLDRSGVITDKQIFGQSNSASGNKLLKLDVRPGGWKIQRLNGDGSVSIEMMDLMDSQPLKKISLSPQPIAAHQQVVLKHPKWGTRLLEFNKGKG